MELYKTPLRVEGWCESLMETTRLKCEHTQADLQHYLGTARHLPALLLTGDHDRIVPPSKVDHLAHELPRGTRAVVHDCGHLSHEEAPAALLHHLVTFCARVVVEVAAAEALQQPLQQPAARQQQQQQQETRVSSGAVGGGAYSSVRVSALDAV